MTTKYPSADFVSDEVVNWYKSLHFPDVSHIECGNIIEQCWVQQVDTAQVCCYFQLWLRPIRAVHLNVLVTETREQTLYLFGHIHNPVMLGLVIMFEMTAPGESRLYLDRCDQTTRMNIEDPQNR